jgi:hypothetical protein
MYIKNTGRTSDGSGAKDAAAKNEPKSEENSKANAKSEPSAKAPAEEAKSDAVDEPEKDDVAKKTD